MNRASLLHLTVLCGGAGKLAAQVDEAGRAAAMSTAFHKKSASEPDWRDHWARLDDEEREEVESWVLPKDVIMGDGVVLSYAKAEKEISCGLDADGRYVPHGDPSAITQGTADMAWRAEICGKKYVIIGDIKKTRWTSSSGAASLQLAMYGLALGDLWGADILVRMLWISEEQRWEIAPDVDLSSEEGGMLWRRVKAAATNDGGFSTGAHCKDCYSRLRCPAYLLPPDVADTSLQPLTDLSMAKAEDVLRLHLLCERAEDTIKRVKDNVKAWVAANGPLVDEAAGKQYGPVRVSGRATFDSKAFEKDHPELAKAYVKIGTGHEQYRWTNVPKVKKAKKEAA